MGELPWWIGNVIVVVAVLPLVALLALRIIRALKVVGAAAEEIRSSLGSVASDVPEAMTNLSQVAAKCERLARKVPV